VPYAVIVAWQQIHNSGFSSQNKKPYTEDEVAGLLRLNRRLSGLEHHLIDVVKELAPRLDAKHADTSDAMADYEIEATFDFVLRESDPDYDENDDNILTSRKEYFLNLDRNSCYGSDVDFCEPGRSNMVVFEGEGHCYLFHDLYDHRYRLSNPAVPLRDCLRIGTVWVDVVIRQQYALDIDTGEWHKWFSPRSKDEINSNGSDV